MVEAILALPLKPPCVLVSGDLVHDGRREDYAVVQELLAPLGDTVVAIPGNHDDPELVRELFGDPGEVGDRRAAALLCDTTLPGTRRGLDRHRGARAPDSPATTGRPSSPCTTHRSSPACPPSTS